MASIVFEVECEVEGNVTRADESVGYAGNEVEDADLSSVMALKPFRKPGDTVWKYKNINLLDGLDKAARQIVIANIMTAFSDEVDDAILSDVD